MIKAFFDSVQVIVIVGLPIEILLFVYLVSRIRYWRKAFHNLYDENSEVYELSLNKNNLGELYPVVHFPVGNQPETNRDIAERIAKHLQEGGLVYINCKTWLPRGQL